MAGSVIKTYADIYIPLTQDQITAAILARFPIGWPINDWNPGATERTHIDLDSFLTADLYQLASLILSSGYLDSAAGDWLTILCLSFFDEARNPAMFTQGQVTLSLAVGAADQTITPGQLWLQTEDLIPIRFSNITGGTVRAGTPLIVNVIAEFAGVSGNVPTGGILIVGTPLPGMTCLNQVVPGSNTWITEWGSDIESDNQLALKCKAKWGAQSHGGVASAYYYWARKAAPQVKKVKVFSNYLAGHAWAGGVTVYLAGDAGPIDPTIVATAAIYITDRIPINSRVQVSSAVALTIPVSGLAKLAPKATLADQENALNVLQTYANVLDIGELVYQSEIIAAIVYPPEGPIRDFKPTSPGGNVQPYRNEVVNFDPTGIVFST